MHFSETCAYIENITDLSADKIQSILSHLKRQEQLLHAKVINVGMINSLLHLLKQDDANINLIIDEWVRKNFDNEELRALHSDLSSLSDLIRNQDPHWQQAWGCDSDFHPIMQYTSHKVNNDTLAVCRPMILVSTDTMLEVSGESFKSFIEKYCQESASRSILLIPLNDGQSHWLLGKVIIEIGQVVGGTLWNSMASGNNAAKKKFKEVLRALKCNEGNIKFLEVNIQHDGFRCFDYVCQEILHSLGKEDSVTQAQNGKDLRHAIGMRIANELNCNLYLENLVTPLTDRFNNLTITDLNVLSAFETFKSALFDHNPKLAELFDKTGTLTIEKGLNQLMLSSGKDSSHSPPKQRLNEKFFISPLTTPNLSEKFEEAVLPQAPKNVFDAETQKRIKKLEQRFQSNYDDSSDDSEDESSDVNTKIDVKNFKSQIAKGQVKYNDFPEWKISFYLHVLGVMLIRTKSIDKHYRAIKQMHLRLSDADLKFLKDKVYDAFKDQFSEKFNLENFESNTWPLFMQEFRENAKLAKNQQQVLFNTIKAIIKCTFPEKRSEVDVIVDGLATKISSALPKRATAFTGNFSILNQENTDHQIMAIIRFLYRFTRRNEKNNIIGKVPIKANVVFFGTKMVEEFTIETKNINGILTCIRNDYIKLSQPSSYPDILNSQDKNGTRRSASIAKYTLPFVMRTQQEFTNNLYTSVQGGHIDDTSYGNFLNKMYYLLQRGEGGRHLSSLIINIMLIQLISGGFSQWPHVFPANDAQQNIFASNHPTLMHPMSFKDAPKAAAILIAHFNDAIEPPLKYYPHQETKEYTQDAAHVIASKQYSIVNQWFFCFKGKNLENTNDEEIIKSLCEMTNGYYFQNE